MSTKYNNKTEAQHDAKLPVRRSFTNVLVEIDGKETIPIRDLPKADYEDFLDCMYRLRLAYISIAGR